MENGQYSILVVSNDDELQKQIKALLTTYEKCCIYQATTIAQLNQILQELDIDIMIMDMLLPDSNAIEWLEKNKTQPPVTIIIEKNKHNIISALTAGATDYLIKPITAEKMQRAIEKAMKTREQLAEINKLQQQIIALQNETNKAIQRYFNATKNFKNTLYQTYIYLDKINGNNGTTTQ